MTFLSDVCNCFEDNSYKLIYFHPHLWVSPAGVHFVFDTTLAAGFSILETQKEFIQRYRRRHHDSHALPMFTSSCPGKPFVLGSVFSFGL